MKTQLTWKIEKRKVDSLKNWERNPRKISTAALAKLKERIEARGFHDVIVLDTDGVILSGNMRQKVLLDLGYKEIDCLVPSRKLTKQESDKIALESNRNDGEWDPTLLLDFDPADLLDVGFESAEVDGMFSSEDDEDFDLEEELEKINTPKAKMGQLYALGEHLVLCGDSTEKSHVEALMGGKKATMVFTDPPYNVDYQGGGSYANHKKGPKKREGILNDKMDRSGFNLFLDKVCQNLINFCTGGIYICMSSSELENLKSSFVTGGGHWQTYIIWVKDNFTFSHSDYQRTYEPILYGYPAKITNHYFSQDRNNADVWENLSKVKSEFKDGYTTISFQGFKVKVKGEVKEGEVIRKKQKMDVWRFAKPTKSIDYPTMKPLELCDMAIRNSSKRGEVVMDLFLGSGSTLIAAEKSGRVCYGMELDPKYIDVIIARWEKESGKKAELLTNILSNNKTVKKSNKD
jgi:DNA modification methylase